MKNSYQDKQTLYGQELLTLRGYQPEVLRLFEDVLKKGSSLRVRVTGRSMAPFLRGGELLTIRRDPCQTLRTGDLILFRTHYDLPLVHRIIRKQKAADGTICLLTKGDALIAFDEEIHESSVLGKVCKVERHMPNGRSRQTDMDSLFCQSMNFFIAALQFFRTRTYFFLSGVAAKKT